MNLFNRTKQQGSLLAAIGIGVAIGLAAVFTGGVALTGVGYATQVYVVGGVAGGAAGAIGSLFGGSSSNSGGASTTSSTGAATSTAEDCTTIQNQYNSLQSAYTDAQAKLSQAQTNLTNASQNASVNTNDYNGVSDSCFPGTAASTTCGTSNSGGCTDLQNQCNNLQALIDATNQATCQVESDAVAVINTANATSTNQGDTDVFTLALSPKTVPQGGSFGLVVTVKNSSIQSFTISMQDPAGNFIGNLANNVKSTGAQFTYQQNFQVPTSADIGTYVVKVSDDANTNTATTDTLLVTSATSTSGTATSSNAFTITLNPNSVHQGGTFTINTTINAADVQTYSIGVSSGGKDLGALITAANVGSTTRPVIVQNSFNVPASLSAGVYTIRVANDKNSAEAASADLVLLAGLANGTSTQTGGTSGTQTTGGTQQGFTGTSNNTQICSVGTDIQMGNQDPQTGGPVTALQNFLISKGLLIMPVGVSEGYFGSLTKTAVKKFQSANGVPSTGYVGPLTRAAIQRTSCGSAQPQQQTQSTQVQTNINTGYSAITSPYSQYTASGSVCPAGYVCAPTH